MKFSCIVLATLFMVVSLPTTARLTYTQKLKQNGRVKLTQDKTIDILVNGRDEDPVVAPAAPSSTKPTNVIKPVSVSKPTTKLPATEAKTPSNTLNASVSKQNNTPVVSSPKEKPATTHLATSYTSAQGYRVKFFMGGSSRTDKEKAQATGKEFKSQFPNVAVYMNFVSPHWICVAGDFKTQTEANAFIQSARSEGYDTSTMTVVKTKIRVPVY